MLQIVHVQSVYNVNKPVTTICMIFVNFFSDFFGTGSSKTETGPVNRQNRSVYQNFVRSITQIQTFWRFEFCTNFVCFGETDKTGLI
jgi:hypothetical protein